MARPSLPGAMVLVPLAAAFLGAWLAPHAPLALRHFADAADQPLALAGRKLYAARCAACHGRNLHGQALWELQDANAPRRAPALDQTGPAWKQPDDVLFDITKFGPGPATMPAFAQSLTDQQILSVVAFIKASWPTGIRIA